MGKPIDWPLDFTYDRLLPRVVNGSVPMWVHGGSGPGYVIEEVGPDPNPIWI